MKTCNMLQGEIKTVDDLLSQLQNFDRDRYLLAITIITCPADSELDPEHNCASGLQVACTSNTIISVKNWQEENRKKAERNKPGNIVITESIIRKAALRAFNDISDHMVTRVMNVFTILGVRSVSDLEKVTIGQLTMTRQCGRKAIDIIKETAGMYNIKLKNR